MLTKYDNCLSSIFALKDMLHNSGYHRITTKESTGYEEQNRQWNKYIEEKSMKRGEIGDSEEDLSREYNTTTDI